MICEVASNKMRSVRSTFGCKAPFACVHVEMVDIPKPSPGEALIRVNSSSVNPSDVDTVELGGCMQGCGADAAGVVVECPKCKVLKVGDEVWTAAGDAYSDFLVVSETAAVLKPKLLPMHEAATIPEVGLTSYFSLKRTTTLPQTPIPHGSPWANSNYSNLTVLITAGTGGTGFIGIELAKVWGAKHIATATTGAEGIAFARKLGATYVTDYKVEDIFESLPDNSVDIVYDNYGAEGTADKAMRTLRAGGVYLLMPHGACYENHKQAPPCLSSNPKPGVRQINYVTGPDFESHQQQGLQELKALFDEGQLTAYIDKTFPLEDISKALTYSSGSGSGGVADRVGKISITM